MKHQINLLAFLVNKKTFGVFCNLGVWEQILLILINPASRRKSSTRTVQSCSHHWPGSQGSEQVRHGYLIPDHELHSAHLPSIPRSQPRNCGAVEPALYSLEDLGLNIVNKQHIDPAHQQQHHDVLDCKQNQAPMITWPPWKTGKAKNVQKKYKNSNLSHNFTI